MKFLLRKLVEDPKSLDLIARHVANRIVTSHLLKDLCDSIIKHPSMQECIHSSIARTIKSATPVGDNVIILVAENSSDRDIAALDLYLRERMGEGNYIIVASNEMTIMRV